jgi:phage terminase large subunit GpA-like protein
MATTWQICSAAFVAGYRPVPDVKVSEWADAHRIVCKPSPAEGEWRTSRVPYVREFMDTFSPESPVEIAVLMKAAQGAGTEAELNAIGCMYDRYADSGMLVLPTVGTAKKFVRTRLDRMIEACPVLRDKVAPARSRSASNTASMKEFGGATLVITGANSGADLRSYPSRYAWMDEVDGYPPDLDGEGDPTELVVQRTAAFANRKVMLISTPTNEETSLIARWHAKGDQRLYYVPCPLCGHEQPLVWGADRLRDGRPGGLRWPKGDPDQVRYQCERCGDQFEEWQKVEPLNRGQWVAQAPGTGGGKIWSGQINALYYPYGWPGNAWVNLARSWESDHRDPIKRRTFINLKLGEPYRDPTEARADSATLMARREAYGPELPAGGCLLVAGADVQADRIEAERLLWGPGEESWSIEYRVWPGDTARLDSACWRALDDWLSEETLSELGVGLTTAACCIDAGYNTQIVNRFCAERAARRVWATVGRAGQRVVWAQKARRQRGKYPPPHVIGVDAAKEIVYARLRMVEPGPGYCHFPVGPQYDTHYFEMLTSEVRVPDYTGPIPKFEWKKRRAGARNEALDARVLAYAALVGLQIQTSLRLEREMETLLRRAASRSAPAAPKASAATYRPLVADDPYLS